MELHVYKWIYCSLIFFTPILEAKQKYHLESRVLFLSPARSGTCWTRYILRHLSHRILYHAHGPNGCRVPFVIDNVTTTPEKPPIILSHFPHFITNPVLCAPEPPANPKSDILLFILRNPLEACIRQFIHALKLSFSDMILYCREPSYDTIFVNMAFFDKWPNQRKLLIYYEDLMTTPEVKIQEIAKFIGEPNSAAKEFLKNLDEHKQNSLEMYREKHFASFTEGADLTYHSRSLSVFEKQQLYLHLKNTNLTLWKKYLSRYDKLYQN